MTFLLALLLFTVTPADSTTHYYAHRDVDALRTLLEDAETREQALLYRYRLYPLTQDERYLKELPEDLPDGTARELALLSGLWGYRAAESAIFRAVRFGQHAESLLQRATTLAPDDPLVLLIEGQSLLFKPRIVGGDSEEALRRFEQLRETLASEDGDALAVLEADLWIWYANKKLGRAEADVLRERLLRQPLPPLYREFLSAPVR